MRNISIAVLWTSVSESKEEAGIFTSGLGTGREFIFDDKKSVWYLWVQGSRLVIAM